MSQPEKRADERIKYEHTIVFRTEKTIMETAIDASNISMSGVYVVTNQPLDRGSKCSIEIKLHDKEDNLVILLAEGVVSRIDNKGQGIEFTALDEDTTARLQQLLSSTGN